MRYQMILDIDDEDIKQAEPRRLVRYNFPEESTALQRSQAQKRKIVFGYR